MLKYPSPVVRMWRARPWNSNPLMRGSDRFEALVRMLAAAVLLLAIPIAGAVGTAGYTAAAARIGADNSTKVVVTAAVTGKSERTSTTMARAEVSAEHFTAPVSWHQDGHSGTATVEVPAQTNPGDEVSVWLAADGNPTGPPQGPGVAVGAGVGAALAVLAGVCGGALVLVAVAAWILGGRRNARWELEWRQFGQRAGGDDSARNI